MATAKKAPAKKAPAKKAPATPKTAAPAKAAPAKAAKSTATPAKKSAAPAAALKKAAPAKKAAAPAKKAPAKHAAPAAAPVKKQPAVPTKAPAKATAQKATAQKGAVGKAAAAKAAPAKAAAAPAKAAPAKAVPAKAAAASAKAAAPSAKKAAAPAVAPKSAAKKAAPPVIEKAPVRGVTKDGIAYTKDFDAKFLTAMRALLLDEKSSLLGQAVRLEDEALQLIEEHEMGDVQFDDEGGEGDTMVVERERDLALSAQARQTIADIEAALDRLVVGTFGYSVESGRPIPRERLEAIPWATVLVEEKVGGIGRR